MVQRWRSSYNSFLKDTTIAIEWYLYSSPPRTGPTDICVGAISRRFPPIGHGRKSCGSSDKCLDTPTTDATVATAATAYEECTRIHPRHHRHHNVDQHQGKDDPRNEMAIRSHHRGTHEWSIQPDLYFSRCHDAAVSKYMIGSTTRTTMPTLRELKSFCRRRSVQSADEWLTQNKEPCDNLVHSYSSYEYSPL